jgi:tetratricopeptide (TPR) repeat protein
MHWRSCITPPRAVLIGSIAAAAIYCRAVRYDFILDDLPLILLNDTITSWRNIGLIFRTHIFYSKYGAPSLSVVHYRPIYMLWLMLNEQLFGKVLPWWHLTSLLLHTAVTFLVYELAVKVLKEPWTAALAALLFAFHPIHVESVSYASASTDLLVALFVLVSLLLYFHFREQNANPGYLILSVLAGALAMMSKETGAMLPWVLVAYEALRENPADAQDRWKRYVWTLPYFAVVAGYAIARTSLFGLNTGPNSASRAAALLDIPLVLIVYLYNFLWPRRLSFYYPVEWTSQWTIVKFVALTLAIMTGVLLWNRYRDRLGARLQIAWAAILFAPPLFGVWIFGREDWVHDRHMYLVSVPLCLIAAVVLRDPAIPAKRSMIASALILVVLFVDTAVQVPRFSDELAVYQSALNVAPRNVTARSFYANALWNSGRREEALQQFRQATELSPDSSFVYESYGAALAEIGRNQEAAAQYARALRLAPGESSYRAQLLYRVATIEANENEIQQGLAHLREALQIDPRNAAYRSMFAQLLRQEGNAQATAEEMQGANKTQRQAPQP